MPLLSSRVPPNLCGDAPIGRPWLAAVISATRRLVSLAVFPRSPEKRARSPFAGAWPSGLDRAVEVGDQVTCAEAIILGVAWCVALCALGRCVGSWVRLR